ncbi:MAG TPA: hypothetical protein VF510_22180 [Ktedonobacterales bacterium]
MPDTRGGGEATNLERRQLATVGAYACLISVVILSRWLSTCWRFVPVPVPAWVSPLEPAWGWASESLSVEESARGWVVALVLESPLEPVWG